jgi:hypothetical protein
MQFLFTISYVFMFMKYSTSHPTVILTGFGSMEYMFACTNVRTYVCMYVCMCVCMYVYICMYVCMYVFFFVYIYWHAPLH